jgi:hypothetical protein
MAGYPIRSVYKTYITFGGYPVATAPMISAFVRVLCPALAGLEARIGFADHVNAPPAFNDLAVAVTVLGLFEGRQDFHDKGSFQYVIT